MSIIIWSVIVQVLCAICLCVCVWLQQTKAKYEIEAEKRELARLLEKRTQEVENLTGKISGLHTHIHSHSHKQFKYTSTYIVC